MQQLLPCPAWGRTYHIHSVTHTTYIGTYMKRRPVTDAHLQFGPSSSSLGNGMTFDAHRIIHQSSICISDLLTCENWFALDIPTYL